MARTEICCRSFRNDTAMTFAWESRIAFSVHEQNGIAETIVVDKAEQYIFFKKLMTFDLC